MANLEASGAIYRIDDTQQITERFRKREFAVHLHGKPEYPQYVLFQVSGDRCEQLDRYAEGDEIEVEFALRGREWTSPSGDVRFFNSLEVWAIRGEGSAESAAPETTDDDDDSDLPF